MRKKLFFLVSVLFVLLCAGCTPQSDAAEKLRQEEIVEISFRSLDSQGNLTILQELDTALYAAFAENFSALPCDTYGNDPIEEITSGPFIHIVFSDGSFYSINHYCTVYFDGSQSKDLRVCYTLDVFEPFWEKYCRTEYEFAE